MGEVEGDPTSNEADNHHGEEEDDHTDAATPPRQLLGMQLSFGIIMYS